MTTAGFKTQRGVRLQADQGRLTPAATGFETGSTTLTFDKDPATGTIEAADLVPAARRPLVHAIENLALSVAIAVMVVLPLVEIVLRRTLHTGVAGASLIVQHLALIVGMLGGAIAAREGRLLALSTVG